LHKKARQVSAGPLFSQIQLVETQFSNRDDLQEIVFGADGGT